MQLGISADAKIDFSDTEFESLFAHKFIFPPGTSFAGATFSGEADFSSTTFSSPGLGFRRVIVADFSRATFSGYADFESATFSGSADFSSTTFSGNANLGSATFSHYADFSGATFSGPAYFESATFSGRADFGSVTFSGPANFSSATFNGQAYFRSGAFSGLTDFTNAKMKSVTVFTTVKFARPPTFFGAELHEGTTWHDVTWPLPPGDREKAAAYVEMDKLKKHGDELDFFSRELQCRRVLLGPWKGLPFAIYSFLSDYGRSYVRPLGLLVATVLVGTIIFAAHEAGFRTPLLGYVRKAAGISFANTLSLLGKPLLRSDVVLADYPDWLKAVATIQTILGIAFLFLFGLGIRNRFRMK